MRLCSFLAVASRRRRCGTARIVSRQPVREQAQRSPSGSTTTCPISPAAPRWPCSSEPSSTSPAPTPIPIRSTIRPPSPVWPKVCSPRTAVLASFATTTGRPRASARLVDSGVSVQARFGASMTVPPASTTPGLPTPMPSTGRSVIAIRSAASRCTRATASAPLAPSIAISWRACTSPSRLRTAPVIRSVGGQVDADDVRGVRRPGRPASAACRPGCSAGAPSSSTRPSPTSSPTRSDTVTRVRPVVRARSARLAGPLAEQLLEQQRPVVAAGVLLEQLAAGPKRPAHRRGRGHVC